MHRRQYISQNRYGYYEVMKWRSHAAKLAAWQREQLTALIDFVICTPSKWEIHQKRRDQLRQMIAGTSLWFRTKVWLRIYTARFALRVSAVITRVKGLFKKAAPATA